MLLYDWNPAEAEKKFRRAIRSIQTTQQLTTGMPMIWQRMNRSDEAVAEIRQALELDPRLAHY